jgi:polysaccharide deacetylase 2 family uncharacterized protein YibQ
MPRVVWVVVAVVVLATVAGILALDRRQAQRGAASLFALPWSRSRVTGAAPASGSGGARVGAAAEPRPGRTHRPEPTPRRIALLIDELGARADVFDAVLALGRPVTVGVLPELPLSRRIAWEAARAGLEVALELPLEPYRFPAVDPGPGVLLVSMAPEDVSRRTRRFLASLPGAAGVTTGMGSRFTEDRVRMRAVLEAMRGEGRYFVDGMTSGWSVGFDEARTLGVPTARRQVLLDPEEDEATVRERLDAAEHWASRRGAVLAVAHGRRLTLRLLAEALPRWEAHGLRVVPVSAVVSPRTGERAPAGAAGPRAAAWLAAAAGG